MGAARDFSNVSADYAALPGQLTRSYGVLLRNNKLLTIARRDLGPRDSAGLVDPTRARQAWQDVKVAYQLERDLDDVSMQLDAALAVLNDYSDLLLLLTSDEYTDSLSTAAVDLGESLDSATATYSKQFGGTVSTQGSSIARIIRSAGGVLVRNRQTVALQRVIQAADPTIQALSRDVEELAGTKLRAALVNYEENYLGKEFVSVAVNARRAGPDLLQAVYADLERVRSGVALADRTAAAAKTYGAAHSELVAKTRTRSDVKGAIEELRTLRKEIKAGKKAAEKVDD